MTSITKSFTEISVLLVSLTLSSAHAASVLGTAGPLMPDENGNWTEFRTNEEDALLSDAGDDASCVKRVPLNLRALFFEHFRYYVDHSKSHLGEVEIARFAKVLGMSLNESGGASAAVTDMSGTGGVTSLHHFYNTDNPGVSGSAAHTSSLDSLDQLLEITTETRKTKRKGKRTFTMKWNGETNFGLLQMSANRLDLNFGNHEDEIARNTLVAMRTLYASHPEEVIDRCGTARMFKEPATRIREAFDAIQTCDASSKNKEEVQCFGRWATLCPNYNLTLALIAPPAYFATRRSAPLCAKTFRKILKSGRGDGGVKTAPTPSKVAGTRTTPPTTPPKLPKVAPPVKVAPVKVAPVTPSRAKTSPTSGFGARKTGTHFGARAANTPAASQSKPTPRKEPVIRGGIEELHGTVTKSALVKKPVSKKPIPKKPIHAMARFGV
jgi:hypothetical protein